MDQLLLHNQKLYLDQIDVILWNFLLSVLLKIAVVCNHEAPNIFATEESLWAAGKGAAAGIVK
jgi:hypothetical protein